MENVMLNTVVSAPAAAPAINAVAWESAYYLAPSTSALKKIADTLGDSIFAAKNRETKIEQIEQLIGYTIVMQVGRDGNDSKAGALMLKHSSATGASKKALNIYAHAIATAKKQGVKTPMADLCAIAQGCYAGMVALLVDGAAIRAATQIGKLTAAGLTPEQAGEKLAAEKAEKAAKAFSDKAVAAGFIHESQVVTFAAAESAECVRLQALLDAAYAANQNMLETMAALRKEASQAKQSEHAAVQALSDLQSKVDIALTLKSIKAAKDYMTA
jgi:protein involved in polysaccharide export with SLBB domain